jgi:threonine synthase
MTSFVSGLSCSRCDRTFDHGEPHNLCVCGSPLLVDYDLSRVSGERFREALTGRAPTMWRYRELLPVQGEGAEVSLGEGFTPLLTARRLGSAIGIPRLAVKDESGNPTGSFKARGLSLAVSMAKSLGASDVCLPSAGNAGGADRGPRAPARRALPTTRGWVPAFRAWREGDPPAGDEFLCQGSRRPTLISRLQGVAAA